MHRPVCKFCLRIAPTSIHLVFPHHCKCLFLEPMSHMKRATHSRGPVALAPGGGALFCSGHGAGGFVLMRLPFLSALAEARRCGEFWILLLLLCRVWLLLQDQVKPGPTRSVGEASADWGAAKAPAAPTRPAVRGGQPQRDLFCERLSSKWAWWVTLPRAVAEPPSTQLQHTRTSDSPTGACPPPTPSVKHGSS